MRDQALSLACVRHGLSAYHAKGVDQLPCDVSRAFEDSLVRSLESQELSRAFVSATHNLLAEIRFANARLAASLGETIRCLSAPDS